MKKKVLSLILASAMVLSMAACSGNEDGPSNTQAPSNNTAAPSGNTAAPSNNTAAPSNNTAAPSGNTAAPADNKAVSVAEAVKNMSADEVQTYIYDRALGDFYKIYAEAKAITDDVDKRYAMMALAEAKMLESGIMLPIQTRGGNYAISSVAPNTVDYALWGTDQYRYHQAVVATELIKAADRAEMKQKWTELRGTGEYEKWAKDYLKGKGYTLQDSYTFGYTGDPKTWDILATSQTNDSDKIVHTFDSLLEYDCEGVQQLALAESYEVSPDGLTYTFKLKEGLVWVDSQGRKVADLVADDFVAGMQHLFDAAGGLGELLEGVIVNAKGYNTGDITDFSQVGVKAPDDRTVVYTLEEKLPYFLSMFGYNMFVPMSRSYYTSQGGKFGADFDASAADYHYGKTPDSIAYCGPYLVTNATEKSTIVYSANPTYWNKDNINCKKLTMLYNDQTDALKAYNDTRSGVLDGCGLGAAAVVKAKEDKVFDEYGYISAMEATTYMGFFNLYRQQFANVSDTTRVISPKSDEEKARTIEALGNRHFRLAFCFAVDRASYRAQSVGEELKYNAMRNSFVPGTYVTLGRDVTVDINGKSTTFKSGTSYGAIVQAQLDADGVKMKAWDPAMDDGIGSSDGFDGWYNPDNAVAELELAIKELGEIGIVVDAEHPIYIDYPGQTYAEAGQNQANAMKQSVEKSLGGKVIVNILSTTDSNEYRGTQYDVKYGNQMNYDLSTGSGWGPDFGDPCSYLDTLLPDGLGYETKPMGLWQWNMEGAN